MGRLMVRSTLVRSPRAAHERRRRKTTRCGCSLLSWRSGRRPRILKACEPGTFESVRPTS